MADRSRSLVLPGLRLAAAVGLGASALLLYWYLAPAASLCGEGGGCDAARASTLAWIGPVPLPAFGVGGFLAVLAASFFPGPAGRLVLVGLAAVGALAGAAFLIVQAVSLGAFCPYCVTADVAAVVALGFAIVAWRRPAPAGGELGLSAIGIAVGVLAPLLIALAGAPTSPPAGPVVEAEGPPAFIAAEARPDEVAVVEFLDFECPACRAQAELLDPVLAEYGGRVRLVRKHLPLPMHEHARDGARAFLCVEAQGKGEAMAAVLLAAPHTDPAASRALADQVGADLASYDSCLGSPEIDARLVADAKDAATAGVNALPTLWVGAVRYQGVQQPAELRAAIDRALSAPR